MAKKIAFFNHKGGVSKTTSAFNIGWKMAEIGKRVLLVDADPQCNLTAMFLGDDFDAYYDKDDTKEQNIMNGVEPVFKGKPVPIEAVNCEQNTKNTNLYLLAGHMNLSELDPQLTFALNSSMTLTSMQNLPGSFNDLIEKTVEKYSIEFVLIDLNPGLSAINQNMFIISDAFIVPTNPDIFCVMAIRSLSRILPTWVKWKNDNIDSFSDVAYPIPSGTPLFIGELIQRFNIRNGVAATPYKPKIQDIKSVVSDFLKPKLQSSHMLFTDEQYSAARIPSDFCIAEIKDFQSLGQKSQLNHVPVFALNDKELEAVGTVKAQLINARNEFNMQFGEIASAIIKLLE